MAALTSHARLLVRAPRSGEGTKIAELWKELWEAHEEWGGYAASRDRKVYAQIANRLDDDARLRGGQLITGRHAHLVADYGGAPVGQVEGWLERLGVLPATPLTCEVRSLIVSGRIRNVGAGRALLSRLAELTQSMAFRDTVVLAAEVLEANPAQSFYAKVGYTAVSYNLRVNAQEAAGQIRPPSAFTARAAQPTDALALAMLDTVLSQRRRAAGDFRFDKPRAIDASWVSAIAAHIASRLPFRKSQSLEPIEVVAVDEEGVVRAAAGVSVSPLDPPFVPSRRALLGRLTVDPLVSAEAVLPAILGYAARFATLRGATSLECTDITPPGTPMHRAFLKLGAEPWSRVVLRTVPGV